MLLIATLRNARSGFDESMRSDHDQDDLECVMKADPLLENPRRYRSYGNGKNAGYSMRLRRLQWTLPRAVAYWEAIFPCHLRPRCVCISYLLLCPLEYESNRLCFRWLSTGCSCCSIHH